MSQHGGGKGENQPKIKKKLLRRQLTSANEWILKYKMDKNDVVKKEDFRQLFNEWLKEFDQQ